MKVLTFVTKRGQIFNKGFAADVFQSPQERAKVIGDKLQVSWDRIPFDEFVMGIGEEFEHVDITEGDIETTAKIALAHLEENPHYYSKLKEVMGKLAKAGVSVMHKGGPGSGRYPAGSGQPRGGAEPKISSDGRLRLSDKLDPKDATWQVAIKSVKDAYNREKGEMKGMNPRSAENYLQNFYQNVSLRALPQVYEHLGIFPHTLGKMEKGGPGSGRYPAGSGQAKQPSKPTPEEYKATFDRHYLDYSRGIGGKIAYKIFEARIRALNRKHGVT
ncbi:MAG: DUF5661 family protein [Gallionella sp.]|jgi:hypothetical protein